MRVLFLLFAIFLSAFASEISFPVAGVCFQPPAPGPCEAAITRYFFNAASQKCETFQYGGCLGNLNNFESEAICQKSCGTALCQLPFVKGACKAALQRYFFNSTSMQCEAFVYGGCNGNANNFETKDGCMKACGNIQCSMKPETGPCDGYFERYFFNRTSNKCESFVYGGCSGNANNFLSEKDCNDQCGASECICPTLYDPVCGFDGRNYSNHCVAKCSGVKVAYEGFCKAEMEGCVCTLLYDPVCGVDGKTYGNECSARCSKVNISHAGECRKECICPAVYSPVCGMDGVEYSSPCDADCAGVKVNYSGPCSDGCVCPFVYSPVCGEDNKNYYSSCNAECSKVKVKHEGECKPEICDDIYDPVCGVDGITYSNPCYAKGVSISYKGVCKFTCEQCAVYFGFAVCGVDGKTYGSRCYADCNNVTVNYNGSCKVELGACSCMDIYEPVCGLDGNTYSNECDAFCHNVKINYKGECKRSLAACSCPAKYNPVCGEDGNTYGSSCITQCSGIKATEGECFSKVESNALGLISSVALLLLTLL